MEIILYIVHIQMKETQLWTSLTKKNYTEEEVLAIENKLVL